MAAELRLAPPDPSGRFDTPTPAAAPELAKRKFSVIKRGVDPHEVEDALRSADIEIRGLRAQIASLHADLAESASRARDRVRESTAAGFLGDEAARMLAATRTAAAELEQRAADRSQQLIDDAKLRSAAILLQLEQETGHRLGELEVLEARTREAALLSTEQIRSDADLYAESIRAGADAYAAHVRSSADLEARSVLENVDDQIEQLTRNARKDAEQVTLEAEMRAEEQLSGIERNQREMAERLTQERMQLTIEREAVDRRRTELIELLDRVQSVTAAGLIELTAQDPTISARIAEIANIEQDAHLIAADSPQLPDDD
jgi:hypothetical protein